VLSTSKTLEYTKTPWGPELATTEYCFLCSQCYYYYQSVIQYSGLILGSMAGPVIQATGRSEFKDGLGSGYSYHMNVCTGLPDHTMQTKYQSQRPSDVETPVPSI
jgi:hypothetical protein